MNTQKLLNDLNANIDSLTSHLKNHKLGDSGFKGYHLFDKQSGIWSTSEIIHILLKVNSKLAKEDWIVSAVNYVAKLQNKDGGWGFRGNGKSIVDITAWACLALSHFTEYKEKIKKGIRFLLVARKNTFEIDKGGWGLTTFEPDRIYSTWIASNCLNRILSIHGDWFEIHEKKEIYKAIEEAQEWIINSKNEEHGWGPLGDENTTLSSSALALISIFSNGHDPRNYKDTFDLLLKNSTHGLWMLETEIVITQEGYELPQEWFTSVYCFRSLIFFAELSICKLDYLHTAYLSLLNLIDEGTVQPAKGASRELIWPIPLMIEALDKFRIFVSTKQKEYDDFLYQKEIEEKRQRKDEIENTLKNLFPYPISQVYSSLTHEIDFHRRFQYLVQLYEITIKYSAIVLLSTVIASNEKLGQLKHIVEDRFRKPTLGDWSSIIEIALQNSAKVQNIIYPWTKEELLRKVQNYIDYDAPKLNLNQTFSEIVSLRNTWTGHGAVRSVYEYKLEIEKQMPLLFTLLNRLMFLAKCNSFLILSSDYNEFGDGDIYKIRVFNGLDILDNDLEIQKRLSEGQREQLIRYVYFHNMESNSIVNLYPFLSYMFCSECKKERFFFYNGIKSNSKSTYLSYECGHSIDYDNIYHFEKRFTSIDYKF